MSLEPKLLEDFARHIGVENGNAIAYQSCYGWLRANSWEGIAKRFKNDSVDELAHGQNFVKYLARFGDFVPSRVDEVPFIADPDPIKIAEFAAKLEQETADSMRSLLKVAEEVGDGDAVEYISGKLADQSVETKKANDFYVQLAQCGNGELVILNRKMEKSGW